MIRHRALQMILIIYDAEELKREVLETVAARGRWKGAVSDDDRKPEEDAPERKKVKLAFDYLVKDGVPHGTDPKHSLKRRANDLDLGSREAVRLHTASLAIQCGHTACIANVGFYRNLPFRPCGRNDRKVSNHVIPIGRSRDE